MADDPVAMDIARLVDEHHQVVYRYAYRLTGSVAEAEDLTQEVFLTAQRKLEQLRNVESVRSWLFTILRNYFLKECQKRRPVPAESLQLDMNAIPAEIPEQTHVDRERLQQALGELPETFRIVVAMFYYEGCSYREIADRLELPIGTVMSRLARAKGHLRSKLLKAEENASLGPPQSTVSQGG